MTNTGTKANTSAIANVIDMHHTTKDRGTLRAEATTEARRGTDERMTIVEAEGGQPQEITTNTTVTDMNTNPSPTISKD